MKTLGAELPAPVAASPLTDRAFIILSAVARAGKAVSLADLSEMVALPKATLHRLCGQLSEQGLLLRDVTQRSYVVGPTLQALALDVMNHGHLRGLRHQVLSDVVHDVGETCNFTTLDGAEVLYLDRVEARWPLRLTMDVGTRVPLHCTASGKLFLAHMPQRESRALWPHLRLHGHTPNTLSDAQVLRAECGRIVEQGYALDREEYITGLYAIAVPVRDMSGQVRAAIAMHGPASRMNEEVALRNLPRLLEGARVMGTLL